ncbi:hypothetical protein B0H13DRAFT_2096064 [Mycena leptocephala]|nr:hypothetical protein B0H13DRAFT_2096064 [Mycena leptocephala]
MISALLPVSLGSFSIVDELKTTLPLLEIFLALPLNQRPRRQTFSSLASLGFVTGINAVCYVFEPLKKQSAFALSGDHRYLFPAYTCFWLFYTVGNSCRGLLVIQGIQCKGKIPAGLPQFFSDQRQDSAMQQSSA